MPFSFQAPIFISFFIALRKMAYAPVPSMQTGGLWWFTDLTAADPYYVLPLVVTGTMFAILEVQPAVLIIYLNGLDVADSTYLMC